MHWTAPFPVDKPRLMGWVWMGDAVVLLCRPGDIHAFASISFVTNGDEFTFQNTPNDCYRVGSLWVIECV